MAFLMAVTLFGAPLFSQTVPVTFHFDPPLDNFQVVRVVGSFNGWNNADNALTMTDTDGDGVFTLTTPLATGITHMYKFCLDADWGQAFTDPDNPVFNVADNNNSVLDLTDPNITYLLPMDINSSGAQYVDVSADGESVRAVIDNSAGFPLDLTTLEVLYDGNTIENPSQYFTIETGEFLYNMPSTPSIGEHTIQVTIGSAIDTISRSSTYRYDPSMVVYHVPTDFYFDTHNSRTPFLTGNINSVSVMGTFNNWNNQFDPMQDEDGDGVWEATTLLEPHGWPYKFQINGGLWTNDFDNPEFNPDNPDNNWIVVVTDSVPTIKLLTPQECTTYINGQTLPPSLDLTARLSPGILGGTVDESTILATLNDDPLTVEFDAETGILSATQLLLMSGSPNHIQIGFSNTAGVSVSNIFTLGLFEPGTGFNNVDAIGDVQYTPPSEISPEELDIEQFRIEAIGEDYDQLHFVVKMGGINDRTRLGLLVTNPVSTLADGPRELDLELPDWNGAGIFLSLADPNSVTFNSTIENRFQESRDPEIFGNQVVQIDAGALTLNQFDFIVPLAYLDSLLGGWNQERVFILFSYVAESDGSGNSTEISETQGGIDGPEDPDIYDAAFIRSGFWQNRILTNYIPAGNTSGPRLSALDGTGRGQAILESSDISDSLATFGPVITFLSPDVTYWHPEVDIAWMVSDTLVNSTTLTLNGVEYEVEAVDGVFTYAATLVEGENTAVVRAVGNNGFATTSIPRIYSYATNHNPSVSISIETNDRVMVLTAHGVSPDSLNMTYTWWGDASNPAPITILPFNYTSITRTIPAANGEYFFNVRVKDSENRTSTARCYITATDSGITAGGLENHAKWIDSAIFYEIYPRSFSEQGGFSGIQARIPDMLDLGINAVWLMPIFEGPTTHGYEITDYYELEQDFGTEGEFESLVTALHANGIKIILDFVVNHTGIGHSFIQNVFQYHEYSPWADWYLWDGEAGNSNYEYYFDWASLPNLNHSNPDVRAEFINVAKYWVTNFSIDGYRCDVAWGVEERNTQFWQEWRQALKNIKPEVFLEAEASSAESVFYDNRFDSANDWELRNRILEAIQGTNTIGAMDAELRRSYPTDARPFRFLENHDESRMAATFDTQRSKLAHSIIMMANGVPLVYSGGEVGEESGRGLINWSDPDNIRPYFKRLIEIRKDYVHTPTIQRLNNNDAVDVYSFASISAEHTVVTVANFRAATTSDFTIDLSSIAPEGDGPFYFTDLMTGEVITVTAGETSAVPVTIEGFGTRIFYYANHFVGVDQMDNPANQIKEFGLNQNYPNPFNPTTAIRYTLPEASQVTIAIFDIMGRQVTELVNTTQAGGRYQIVWDGRNSSQIQVASGVYFYRMIARNQGGTVISQQTKRMLLVK